MAYEKQTWRCGDTITADRMNHIEDGIANVDVGYSCSEEWVTLTDESVTTTMEEGDPFVTGGFTYSEPITADTIKVTFNGTEYTCNKIAMEEFNAYGGVGEQDSDFSQYPFVILSVKPSVITLAGERNTLYTETAGTYQVKIEAYEETIETSECFDKARGYSCNESTTLITNETINSTSF